MEQQTQAYKIFTKIGLNNWHYIDRKVLSLNESINFFTGHSGSGKSTVIDAMLKSYQGVIAASTGHISVHEAGAIEFGGHKVLTLPHHNGKISASQIRALLEQYQNDANHDHMVMPGMVYLSQPTENGTLYSLEELDAAERVMQALVQTVETEKGD